MLFVLILTLITAFASPIKLLKIEKKPELSKALKDELAFLKKENQKLDLLLKKKREPKKIVKKEAKSIYPTIFETKQKILTGSIQKGILVNSIFSTNLLTPIIVKVTNGTLKGGKLLCKGLTVHKRVQTKCDRLIFKEKDREVSTQLLNLDGSSGLKGYYDDKEEEFLEREVFESGKNSTINAANSLINQNIQSTIGSQLISGTIEGLSSSENYQKNLEPIVTIESGTQVLIFFKETLDDI